MLSTCFDPLCVRSDMPERLGPYGTRCCANGRKESLLYSVYVLTDEETKKKKSNFSDVSMLLETVRPGPLGTPINQVNINNSSFSGRMVLQSDFLAVTRAE